MRACRGCAVRGLALRVVWLTVGVLCVAMGVVATVVPLLPTTPFVLLAAFAFANSSERLHTWLLEHPALGPPIRDWRDGRRIRRTAKWLASVSIAAAFTISVVLGLKPWVLALQAIVLGCVVAYIWTRPEPVAVPD